MRREPPLYVRGVALRGAGGVCAGCARGLATGPHMRRVCERFIMRDEDGWSVQTKHILFHPHSYGIATLMRIGIQVRGRKFVVHHFRPHNETEFHDHPWSFRTFVLWGGYTDESLGTDGEIVRDVLRAPTTRWREATHAHRTTSKGHVWTLVLTTRKQRTWCKGTPESWICGGEVTDFDATRGMVKIGHDA